jgi:hypothetical protein
MLFLIFFLLTGTGIGTGFFYWSQSPIDEVNLPVIMEAKEDACTKVRPDATENASVPYSNITIYSELEERAKEPVVEQLLPEPEKPALESKNSIESVDTPSTEVTHLKSNTLAEPPLSHKTGEIQVSPNQAPAGDKCIIASKSSEPKQATTSGFVKPSNISNNATHMVVENASQEKNTPKVIDTVLSKKPIPPVHSPDKTSADRTYWVEFKPLSSSKEAEHMWHRLITNTSASTTLMDAQHKIRTQSSSEGKPSYILSTGPFSKDAALACCQRLRQAKVNCRVIKK